MAQWKYRFSSNQRSWDSSTARQRWRSMLALIRARSTSSAWSAARRAGEGVHDEADLHDLLDGRALEAQERLERPHDREAVGGGDDRAAAGATPQADQPLGLEDVERLAQRRPAHAELGDEVLGRGEVRASLVVAGEDPLPRSVSATSRAALGTTTRAPGTSWTGPSAGPDPRVRRRRRWSLEIEPEEGDRVRGATILRTVSA